MVPECASEVAANGDETREQDGGEMLARCVPRDGHVPRAHGLHPVAASPQPAVQRHGRPAEPQLHGLPIAPVLRLMSAINNLSDSPFRVLTSIVIPFSLLLK